MLKKLLLLLFSTLFFLGLSASNVYAMTGAIFTTDSSCGGVNVNIFTSKDDVYLEGGPHNGSSAGLPNGFYYVKVTEPDGTLLGASGSAVVEVSGGIFASCYNLFALTAFADTSNLGGEYKVWVSTDVTFPDNLSKTDNFKVKGVGPTPTPVPRGELIVQKFYDKNANGFLDGGEPLLDGWKIHIQDAIDYIRYTLVDIFLDPDDYTISEYPSLIGNWVVSTADSFGITLVGGGSKTVTFGNYCLVPSGGKTLGFWSNKNGQALETATDFTALTALNLRNANGSNRDFASSLSQNKTDLKNWLLNATATNMAYMLSAQLATTKLDLLHGLIDGGAFYIPYGGTVNALMAAADVQLLNHPLTTSAIDPVNRALQEPLKNYLDQLNNGANVVPVTPCNFSFAE